jgi:hypothetical protein
VVLNAGAASAIGDVIECSGITHLHLFAKITSSVATLVGSIQFASTPDGSGDLSTTAAAPNIATPNNAFAETVAPTGISLDSAAAQITIASPGTGAQLFQVRLSSPPQYVVPRFVYTSGGGTVAIQVFAYGFSIKT